MVASLFCCCGIVSAVVSYSICQYSSIISSCSSCISARRLMRSSWEMSRFLWARVVLLGMASLS